MKETLNSEMPWRKEELMKSNVLSSVDQSIFIDRSKRYFWSTDPLQLRFYIRFPFDSDEEIVKIKKLSFIFSKNQYFTFFFTCNSILWKSLSPVHQASKRLLPSPSIDKYLYLLGREFLHNTQGSEKYEVFDCLLDA